MVTVILKEHSGLRVFIFKCKTLAIERALIRALDLERDFKVHWGRKEVNTPGQ